MGAVFGFHSFAKSKDLHDVGTSFQTLQSFADLSAASSDGVDRAIAMLGQVLDRSPVEGASPHPLKVFQAHYPQDDPAFEIPHNDGCCCAACGGFRPEDVFPDQQDGATAPVPVDPDAAPAAAVVGTLGEMADYLTTDFWVQWSTVPREFNLTSSGLNPKSGVLHYNVTGFSNAGSAGTDTNGISTARADLVRDVLDVYSAVLGITFVETTSSDVNVTDLFFKDNASGAFANSAGYSTAVQYSWVNVAPSWSGGTSDYNDYTLQTIFHEVGHALGLGHQGLYNGSGSYVTDADFTADSWQASMMSYFSQTENTQISADFAYLQTPMAVDWIALQDLYGDQSHGGVTFGAGNAFTGDTVYGFQTNITAAESQIWAQFSTYADKTASTIIDAGGTDTLNVSGYSANQLINLTVTQETDLAPSTSNIGGLVGNLTLAAGTVIENAVGGSGDDTFYGNSAANAFTGNAGDDVFFDSAGGDTYYGGGDSDTVSYALASVGVAAALGGAVGSAGAAGDRLYSIETLIGSDFADVLTGDDTGNSIQGGDGDDLIHVGAGVDAIDGGQGNDTASYAGAVSGVGIRLTGAPGWAAAAGDTMTGVENLIGSDFRDNLVGDDQDNTLEGGDGDDVLYGKGGDDLIIGGLGADTINGHTGNDTASYQNATQGVIIALDGSVGAGGAAGDTLAGIENLIGSDYDDNLIGSQVSNVIDAGDGDDAISLGKGADTVDGGQGVDTVAYIMATRGVGVRLDGTAGWAGAAGDKLTNVENLYGSKYRDNLVGDDSANILYGADGDDVLYGKGGDDLIIGGLGADTINGHTGNDTVSYAYSSQAVAIGLNGGTGNGGASGDTLAGIENLIGTDYNDTFWGSNVSNIIQSGKGDDKIYVRDGADTIDGGDGTDTVSYQSGSRGVGVRLDGTAGWAGAAGDTLANVENLIGTSHKDNLVGDGGVNMLDGGAGDDLIIAKGGADTVIGGAGDDMLHGQGGHDLFVFQDGFGHDTIADFRALNALEKIDFTGLSTIASYAAMVANGHLSQVGLDVVIDDLAGNTITLLNTLLGDLDQTDFAF